MHMKPAARNINIIKMNSVKVALKILCQIIALTLANQNANVILVFIKLMVKMNVKNVNKINILIVTRFNAKIVQVMLHAIMEKCNVSLILKIFTILVTWIGTIIWIRIKYPRNVRKTKIILLT